MDDGNEEGGVEEAETELGEEEEGEEETSPKKARKGRKDEAKEREKQLRLLKQYVDEMVYKVPEFPRKDTPRTEKLAKPLPRRTRTKRSDKQPKVIAVEDLQKQIEAQEKREQTKLKAKRRRKRMYHTIIEKLKRQWHEHFMKVIVKKFADTMAEKTTTFTCPSVTTESRQRLIRGLVCNIFLALGLKQAPCSMDQSLYDTMGYVLADFILEAMFEAHYKEKDPSPPKLDEPPRLKCMPLDSEKPKPKKPKPKHSTKNVRKKKPLALPKLPTEFKFMLDLLKRKFNECKEEKKQKELSG